MSRSASLAAVVAAVLGGFLIGKLGQCETVLLGGLGYGVGWLIAWGAPARARPSLVWPGLAWLVVGAGLSLVMARVPFEPSLPLAARSVVLNPVIVAGFCVGGRLLWLCLRSARPLTADAPSAASHLARPPARTRAAGSP